MILIIINNTNHLIKKNNKIINKEEVIPKFFKRIKKLTNT